MIERGKIQDAVHDVAVANKLSAEHKSAFKRMTGQVFEKLEPAIAETVDQQVAGKVEEERNRLKQIVGSEDAKGREALAIELASSGLDPEAALKILRETPAAANGRGLLAEAMKGYQVNISDDCPDWRDQSEEEQLAQEILNA